MQAKRQRSAPDLPVSIPDYIASQLGVAIIDGEYSDGEHLPEEEIAEKYAVSRAPVREAISKLERRGLVRILPRRGAFVIGHSLDVVTDVFNVRAVLVGLAGRYFVRNSGKDDIDNICGRLEELKRRAARKDTDPREFTLFASQICTTIYEKCGAEHLARMLAEQAHGSVWGMIWRNHPLDYLTPARRIPYASDFASYADLAAERKDEEAEQLLRRLIFESRDEVLRSIAKLRGDQHKAPASFHDRGNVHPLITKR